jgi:hypothetical protein
MLGQLLENALLLDEVLGLGRQRGCVVIRVDLRSSGSCVSPPFDRLAAHPAPSVVPDLPTAEPAGSEVPRRGRQVEVPNAATTSSR